MISIPRISKIKNFIVLLFETNQNCDRARTSFINALKFAKSIIQSDLTTIISMLKLSN